MKILRFRKDDAEQPWGDMGIHQVSVMTSDATEKIANTSIGMRRRWQNYR